MTVANPLTPEQRVVEHFNRSADSYGDVYHSATTAGYFFRRRQDIVFSLLDQLGGGRVLDVGCGPGLMAEPCLSRGFSFSGVDISAAMIAECCRRLGSSESATFSVGKLQHLPFPDASFDVVLCMGVLEYVANKEQSTAISEMRRVLRPGGLLVISCLNSASLYWMLDRYVYRPAKMVSTSLSRLWSGIKPNNDQDSAPIREFSEASFRKLLQHYGFSVTNPCYYGTKFAFEPFDKILPRLTAWASETVELMSKNRLRRLAMAFIVLARKDVDAGLDACVDGFPPRIDRALQRNDRDEATPQRVPVRTKKTVSRTYNEGQ
jgi:ubiquinone/menaquinone biosynthesis C-methylase UbiE